MASARLAAATTAEPVGPRLAEELAEIAVATDDRGRRARQPIFGITTSSALAIGLARPGLSYLARHVHTTWKLGTIAELFEKAEAVREMNKELARSPFARARQPARPLGADPLNNVTDIFPQRISSANR